MIYSLACLILTVVTGWFQLFYNFAQIELFDQKILVCFVCLLKYNVKYKIYFKYI